MGLVEVGGRLSQSMWKFEHWVQPTRVAYTDQGKGEQFSPEHTTGRLAAGPEGPGSHGARGSANPTHGSPGRSLKLNCNLEQAKPLGWWCSSHLWFPKDPLFKWEKELLLQPWISLAQGGWVFLWVFQKGWLWGRSLPSSQIIQLLDKIPLSFSHQTSASGICLYGWWQAWTPLLFSNT